MAMETILTSDEKPLQNDYVYETILNIERKYQKSDFNEVNFGLSAEEGNVFFQYLKKFNLTKDPRLLILPPHNHYYFDKSELRRVRTIINLKNLNLVKDLDSFLLNLSQLMAPDANFVGYFSFNKMSLKWDGLVAGLSSRLNNLLDLRTDHNMDKKELSLRMQKNGFKIVNMTDLNGYTYFYSQRICNYTRARS